MHFSLHHKCDFYYVKDRQLLGSPYWGFSPGPHWMRNPKKFISYALATVVFTCRINYDNDDDDVRIGEATAAACEPRCLDDE